MKVGELIKKCREQVGMTQAELAEILKITPQAISQYERGVKTPKVETLKRIADGLGVRWTDLCEDVDDKTRDAATIEYTVKLLQETAQPVRSNELIHAFYCLNREGKREAIKRVKELAYVPEYQESGGKDG